MMMISKLHDCDVYMYAQTILYGHGSFFFVLLWDIVESWNRDACKPRTTVESWLQYKVRYVKPSSVYLAQVGQCVRFDSMHIEIDCVFAAKVT